MPRMKTPGFSGLFFILKRFFWAWLPHLVDFIQNGLKQVDEIDRLSARSVSQSSGEVRMKPIAIVRVAGLEAEFDPEGEEQCRAFVRMRYMRKMPGCCSGQIA